MAARSTKVQRRPHLARRIQLTAQPKQIVLLVGQTARREAPATGVVPTRPSQTDPRRAEAWARRRSAVGSRIRALRLESGLTQEQLALHSGVTRNVLIDVEHGKRGLLYERLFDLADGLGVPVTELLAEEGR